MKLSQEIIFVTDGGSVVIKSLRDRFGDQLIHQSCTLHEDRNIQKHLDKKHRQEASRNFKAALEQTLKGIGQFRRSSVPFNNFRKIKQWKL